MQEGIGTLISGSLERLSDEQIMGALSQRSQLLLNIAVQKQGGEAADAFGRENADQSRIEAEIVAKY